MPCTCFQLPQSELDAIAGEGDMAEPSEEDLAERKRRFAAAREVCALAFKLSFAHF